MKTLYTWTAIAAVVVFSTAGDVLLAYSMRKIGDLGLVRAEHGLREVIKRVVSNPYFLLGVLCMSCAFFSLLVGLSWADVSLFTPASAGISFVTNAIAAKIFLKENVDRRRCLAALFVAAGITLLPR